MRRRCLAWILVAALWAAGLPQGVKAAELGISAQAYLLMEASSGRVILAQNERQRLPMASTTKIMTALLTLEQPDLDAYFTVDAQAIRVEGSSMGLREGDQVTLRALAAGMLLSSGNDAAQAAAVSIDKSVEAFAKRMNGRAAELGMEDTHFVTPSGLHDDEHYSTAADMALLARSALQNEAFVSICSKSSMKLSFGNPPFDRWLKNHNRLLKEYEGCIGMKTGFTKKAGRCLVTAAERDGVTLICVTLNAPNDWRDHTRLLDYGFSQVKPEPFQPDVSDLSIRVVGAEEETLPLAPLSGFATCLTAEEQADVIREVSLAPFAYAPVAAGDIVGEVRYTYNGFLIGKTALVTAGSAGYYDPPPKTGLWEKIKAFFAGHFR